MMVVSDSVLSRVSNLGNLIHAEEAEMKQSYFTIGL